MTKTPDQLYDIASYPNHHMNLVVLARVEGDRKLLCQRQHPRTSEPYGASFTVPVGDVIIISPHDSTGMLASARQVAA